MLKNKEFCYMLGFIKEILGEPYYENDYGLIYNMDCEIGLERLQNSFIDITITSPPYNIGKEYEQTLRVPEYIEWLERIFYKVYSLTKSNGSFFLNVGYLELKDIGHAVPITYLIWERIKFYLMQEIVWNYGAGVAAKKFLSPRNEKILWYVKNKGNYTFNLDEIRDPNVKYPNQKKNGKLRCNTIGKNPSDVWQIAKVTSGRNRSSRERMPHPAQYPEDLIKRIILGFSYRNDLVLDPFIGSGTTAKVAMMNNRRFLGFEIREDYCNTCLERLEKARNEISIRDSVLTLF